jgi:hypothetical protein
MPKKLYLYFNQATGDIVRVTKQEAKNLPADFKPITFVKNDKGEDVMRFNFDGATVDVQENVVTLPPEATKEPENGDTKPE